MLSTIGNLFVKLLGGSRNERLVRARMNVVREQINTAGEQLDKEYRALAREAAGAYADQLTADQFVALAEDLRLIPLSAKQWLIGNNKGHTNGWVGPHALFGKAVEIDNG